MNLFVRKVNNSISENTIAESDLCEHVEEDHALAYATHSERDSFGPVCVYVCCAECHQTALDEVQEETHVCRDCKKEFPLREGILWKWYDFYEAQGDTPVPVCDSCRKLERHQARVQRDQEDREWELGR